MQFSLFLKIITYELMININKCFNIFIVNVHEHFLNILRDQCIVLFLLQKNKHYLFK